MAVAVYGSSPSTLVDNKHLFCPPDKDKIGALKVCMKGTPKPDKDAVSKYVIIPDTIS